MNDTATPRAEAASLLASSFFEMLCEEGITFETFESRSISIGHEVIASAMSIAIERLDAKLCDLVLYGHWEKDGFEAPDRDASYAEMALGGSTPGTATRDGSPRGAAWGNDLMMEQLTAEEKDTLRLLIGKVTG